VDRVTDCGQVGLEQFAVRSRLALAQFLLDDMAFDPMRYGMPPKSITSVDRCS